MESYEQLTAYTDEQLVELFNNNPERVRPGRRQWYLDELVRRRQDRATEAMVDLTKRLGWLTVVLVVLTLIGTAAALYAAVKAG